jgi:hypothetical protein
MVTESMFGNIYIVLVGGKNSLLIHCGNNLQRSRALISSYNTVIIIISIFTYVINCKKLKKLRNLVHFVMSRYLLTLLTSGWYLKEKMETILLSKIQ